MENILYDIRLMLKDEIDKNLNHVKYNQIFIEFYINYDLEKFNKYLKENNQILHKNLKILYLYQDIHRLISVSKYIPISLYFLN
jgi:hypothetical protein